MSQTEASNPQWRSGGPAPPEALSALVATYPAMPAAYVDFLRTGSGAEGDLGVAPGWIQIWPAERVVQLNAAYGVAEFLTDFVGFASDGGAELFAFDTRAAPWRIVRVPMAGMGQSDTLVVASDFAALAREFGRLSRAG